MNIEIRNKMIENGIKAIEEAEKQLSGWADGTNKNFSVKYWERLHRAYKNAVEALQAGTEVEFAPNDKLSYSLRIVNTKIDLHYIVGYPLQHKYRSSRFELCVSFFRNPAVAAMIELHECSNKRAIREAEAQGKSKAA